MYRKKKKKEEEPKVKYERIKKRAEADRLIYYILHTMIATLLFILVAIRLDFFLLLNDSISYLFTWSFMEFVLIIFLWNIICSFLARIIAYYLLKGIYYRSTTKNIFELNSKGINRMSFRYFLALFITSILWTLGALVIVSEQIFGTENQVFALVLTYIIIKITVFMITKVIIDARS